MMRIRALHRIAEETLLGAGTHDDDARLVQHQRAAEVAVGAHEAHAIGHGIHVNAVDAGDVVTNLANDVKEDGRNFLAENGKGASIGRAAELREIAEIIAFLASDKAGFIVGAVVMADGE